MDALFLIVLLGIYTALELVSLNILVNVQKMSWSK
jgi:hypothetical protein